MKRFIYVLAAALLGAGLVMAAFDAAAQHSSAEPAAGAADAASPDARRADLQVFRTEFLARDRSYSESAREEAETRLAALEAQAGVVSQAYFDLELARIAALADNGHTGYLAEWRSRRFNVVPNVRTAPFGEDFYVLRAAPENADLLGARLVAIDGRPIAEVRAAARTLLGGMPSWRDRFASYLFESPEQLHALGLTERPDRAAYRFQLVSGRLATRRFTAEPPGPSQVLADSERWLYPEPMQEEGGRWRTLLAVDQAPWSLREPDRAFRMRDAPEIDAFVVQLRMNMSWRENDIIEFMLDSLEAARASGRRNIVLDMRMNGGGDLNNTRAWARRLPRVVPGRVFVLTSPWTFSAGISTIGYLKQEAPDRVVIVGEPVGDRLDFYAEGDMVQLPNSGGALSIATERHDYVTGCRNIENCHGSVSRYPISVASLAPDIDAPWTIEAYSAGRDPAMEAVAAALR